MNNAEKFEEVFGHKPEKRNTIFDCPDCPRVDECEAYRHERFFECTIADWWDEEYIAPRPSLHFPEIAGEEAEIFLDGKWQKGTIVEGYRFRDGIVTIKLDSTGQTVWCGQSRTDLYRKYEAEAKLELQIDDHFKQYMIDKFKDELEGIHYIFKFPNNYGASVIKGKYTYGGERDLWEMGLIFFNEDGDWKLTYERDFNDDVKGYLTDEQVNELLEKIKQY